MSAVLSREDNTTAPLHNTTLFAKNDEKKSTIKINPIDRHHCRTSSPPSSFLACLACSLVRTYVRSFACVCVRVCLLACSLGRSVGRLAGGVVRPSLVCWLRLRRLRQRQRLLLLLLLINFCDFRARPAKNNTETKLHNYNNYL